ncbi:hypothetical protein H6F43_15510 [Leptolyngbya sp. FACHB-36]|nr:hypothetical protein [Leptolyngbya sp. FACHB-36]
MRPSPSRRKNLWFERLMALLATANFGLVLFDLSYVPWRDFWLRGTFQLPLVNFPLQVPMPRQITQWYDPIKGIEPHRDTQDYLQAVQQLEQQVVQQGLNSPEVQRSLANLRDLSVEMIDTNPFALANKSGTLEKIKNRMRDRMFGDRRESARQAFQRFWSTDYLTPANWQQEIGWFNRTVTPLIQTNYYRSIGESGDFTNNFGVIDTPFALLFLLEFLARTFYLSRRYRSLSWRDAMLWRWYDIPLFLPLWLFFPPLELLRAIPVAVRLHQAELVDLERVRNQATQQFVSSIADELTEVVVVQVIDQAQAAIQRGEVSRWLSQAVNQPRVDLNNTDEVAAISTLLVRLTVYEVLPKIQPDITALLTHNLEGILNQSPAYQALKNLPGAANIPIQLTDRLVAEAIQLLQTTLTNLLSDTAGAELSGRLAQNFAQTLGSEVQDQRALQQIQALLTDLLEEVKLGFVAQAGTNPEALLEETRQLRQIARRG